MVLVDNVAGITRYTVPLSNAVLSVEVCPVDAKIEYRYVELPPRVVTFTEPLSTAGLRTSACDPVRINREVYALIANPESLLPVIFGISYCIASN
jgi:hypothetical protein